jgi:hypothetical protein
MLRAKHCAARRVMVRIKIPSLRASVQGTSQESVQGISQAMPPRAASFFPRQRRRKRCRTKMMMMRRRRREVRKVVRRAAPTWLRDGRGCGKEERNNHDSG